MWSQIAACFALVLALVLVTARMSDDSIISVNGKELRSSLEFTNESTPQVARVADEDVIVVNVPLTIKADGKVTVTAESGTLIYFGQTAEITEDTELIWGVNVSDGDKKEHKLTVKSEKDTETVILYYDFEDHTYTVTLGK